MSFLVVSKADSPVIQELGLDIPLAVIELGESGPIVSLDGVPLAPPALHLGALASVVCSKKAKAEIAAFEQYFVESFGQDAPVSADLTSCPEAQRSAQLSAVLLRALREANLGHARRNVSLQRSIAELRKQHTQMQSAFSALERYVYDAGVMHRSLTLELMPAADELPLALPPGGALVQRLPCSSSGLSDLAISIDESCLPAEGDLVVSLATLEDEQVHAQWTVSGTEIETGWLRFSLPVSLEADERTPVLRVEWQGQLDLALGAAMHHPDPRFQATIDGASQNMVLAIRAWSYVAGCEAPASEDGHLPNHNPVRRRLISAERLSKAENLTPACTVFQFLDDSKALLVHAVPDGPSVARIGASVGVGVSHISASIMTRNEQAPDLDYAIAVAPAQTTRDVPQFEPLKRSPWLRLSAMHIGEVHLYLPEPIEATHDLYLMVRPSEGVTDVSWSWSTFFAIALHM